jgi:hypothetical protein
MAHGACPTDPPDSTFDLDYAAPGSVFLDPTNPSNTGSGNLLMIYEGTNGCIGTNPSAFYSTIGIATSGDFGHTWPTYRANFTPLPAFNQSQGPMAPLGAWGRDVCWGNFCSSIDLLQPPSQYGRYAVSGAATTVTEAIQESTSGQTRNTGDSEPSAFVDDLQPGSPTYVYVPHTYNPGPFAKDSPLYPGVDFDLSISRIRLNGGSARAQATHWYQGQFNEPGLGADSGIGGHESSIFANLDTTLEKYQHCLAPSQHRSAASISFSEATAQYVLTFVCTSPTEPLTEHTYQSGTSTGGAWFYSTIDADAYDLSHQEQWSVPSQMTNSWSPFDDPTSSGCKQYLDGWYPSLMSIGAKPGFLTSEGYVFYLKGCTGSGTSGGRKYSSRAFTIHLN